jgi:hypothetical protein
MDLLITHVFEEYILYGFLTLFGEGLQMFYLSKEIHFYKFCFFRDSSCICIQDMFPAYSTPHAGIDKTLLNDIRSLISEGTFDNQECSEGGNLFILDLLKRLQYYSYCRNLLLGQLAFSNKNQKVINKSGSLSSPSGCNESIELKSKEQKYLCYQLEIKASSTHKSRTKTFYIV